MTRRTRSLPVGATTTWGGTWTDFDGNGFPDLLIGHHSVEPDLLLNDDGTFAEADVNLVNPPGYEVGHKGRFVDRHTCGWGEANGDGLPDLYCDVGANKGIGIGSNQLYLQQPDHSLREVGASFRVEDRFGRSKSVDWLDVDGDLDLDLFVGNALRIDRPAPNEVFLHTRSGLRRADVGLSDRLQTMSTEWADWDLDGDPDLLLFQYPSTGGLSLAYENVRGRYRRVSVPGVTAGHWHTAAWGDFDGDGRPDLATVSIPELAIFRNTRSGFRRVFGLPLDKGQMAVWFDAENDGDLDLFVVQGAPPPMPSTGANEPDLLLINSGHGFRVARVAGIAGPRDGCGDSAAAADFDRDGRVDLFVTNGAEGDCRGKDELLRNVSIGGNWVSVDLRGADLNPWGFGARIHVRAGDLVYWRELTDGMNFRSQSEVGHQVLGIGVETSASVRVVWPDGATSCARLTAGENAVLQQGVSSCRD